MKALFLILALLFSLINVAFSAVNLNTANQSQLEGLKGIGPVKAKAILNYRKKNGAFKSVDDLQNVPGFGDKTIANIRAKLSVTTSTPVKKTAPPPAKKPNNAAAPKPAPITPTTR
jgi:competence protein ComEA